MSVMSPRLVLSTVGDDGRAPLPASIEGVPVWSRALPWADLDAVIYTDDSLGRVVVIQRVAPCTLPGGAPGVLSVAWVPAETRDGDNPLFDQLTPALVASGLIVGGWPVDPDMGVTALEADTSATALVALTSWPSSWRRRQPADDVGAVEDALPSPPTGPRRIAKTIA